MIDAASAKAMVTANLSSEVDSYLLKVEEALKTAKGYSISIKAPKNPSVLVQVVLKLDSLGYQIKEDSYSDQRESWNDLIISF